MKVIVDDKGGSSMFRTRTGYKRGKFLVKDAVNRLFMRVVASGSELFERRIEKIKSANFYKK